jgi:hypothetical protein
MAFAKNWMEERTGGCMILMRQANTEYRMDETNSIENRDELSWDQIPSYVLLLRICNILVVLLLVGSSSMYVCMVPQSITEN